MELYFPLFCCHSLSQNYKPQFHTNISIRRASTSLFKQVAAVVYSFYFTTTDLQECSRLPCIFIIFFRLMSTSEPVILAISAQGMKVLLLNITQQKHISSLDCQMNWLSNDVLVQLAKIYWRSTILRANRDSCYLFCALKPTNWVEADNLLYLNSNSASHTLLFHNLILSRLL